MSIVDNVKDAWRDELAALIVRLPVEGVKLLVQIVQGALKSDDPLRYLQRRAAADASEIAAEETIRTTLAATSKKD